MTVLQLASPVTIPADPALLAMGKDSSRCRTLHFSQELLALTRTRAIEKHLSRPCFQGPIPTSSVLEVKVVLLASVNRFQGDKGAASQQTLARTTLRNPAHRKLLRFLALHLKRRETHFCHNRAMIGKPSPRRHHHPNDTKRHETTRHDTTRHDTTRHDTIRHDTKRHDTRPRACDEHRNRRPEPEQNPGHQVRPRGGDRVRCPRPQKLDGARLCT